jgi:hypothetical protein
MEASEVGVCKLRKKMIGKSYLKRKLFSLPSLSSRTLIHQNSVILFQEAYNLLGAWIVGIATGYAPDDRGVGVPIPEESRFFSSPRRPDWLWGPPKVQYNGYRGLLPRGQSGRGVKLTTHLRLMPRSRQCGSMHPLLYRPSWRNA